jgi:hypothetical protein
VPPKIWRPKMQNKFKPDPIHHYSDIDEANFLFPKLGKCILKTEVPWTTFNRNDIITFDTTLHESELLQNFIIGSEVSTDIKNQIVNIVKKNWDSFCGDGARRPIIGYEFAINTGSHTPVCK